MPNLASWPLVRILVLIVSWVVLEHQVSGQTAGLRSGTLVPANGANNVNRDTTLKITFSSPVMLGTAGQVRIVDAADGSKVDTIDLAAAPTGAPAAPSTRPSVSRIPATRAAPSRSKSVGGLNGYNYYPIVVTGNVAEIFPAPGVIAAGKAYYVEADAGVFKTADASSEAIGGATSWRFTTKASAPPQGATKLTVASDGTGDFSTLQAALDFIPDGNTTPITITLRKGTYTELVYIQNKNGITIVGEDRKQTVLEYATNDQFNSNAAGPNRPALQGGYRRGVFRAVRCNDLILSNFTIRNTTPQGGSQAEAIILNGTNSAHAILSNIDLYSYQDTLQINGQAYVKDCFIEGDVDFLWGTGPCFFENCMIRSVRNNAYYTQIRNTAANHGYVFNRCTFTGAEGITGNVLSRIDASRFPNSEVVLIDCVLGPAVGAVAWKLDGAQDIKEVHYWEFNSRDLEGKPVDASRRLAGSRQLKQPEDAELIKNYSNPVFVLGQEWDPRTVAMPAIAPTPQAAASPLRPDPREIPVPVIVTSHGKLKSALEFPVQKGLPDVMTMLDGTRITSAAQWPQRREEMKRILEDYAVGVAPPAPGNVKGTIVKEQSVLGGKAKYRLVHLTFGPDEKLSLDIGIFTPSEGGPFPAVIMPGGTPPGAAPLAVLPQGPGQGRGVDALLTVSPATQPTAPANARPGNPETLASGSPALAHGFALVTFNNNDCGEDTTLRNPDGSWAFRNTRFYPAYPGYDWGLLRGWAWGVSRIVDYLETDASIDKTRLIVSGVSRTGKSALIAGAFDDRIAVVAPVASSGGGTPAFRFSGAERGGNEGLSEMMRKYPNWFSPNLHQFWGETDRLPFDQHWLIAMVAPRPFIALEGTNDQNVNAVGVKQSFIGAQPAFDLLKVPDRIGINWAERPHGIVQGDWDAMLKFADKHLLGKTVDRTFDQFPAKAQ